MKDKVYSPDETECTCDISEVKDEFEIQKKVLTHAHWLKVDIASCDLD